MDIQKFLSSSLLIVIVLYFIELYLPNISGYSLIGLGVFLFFGFFFIFQLGNTLPIRSLIILIAFLQWVIGPVLAYHLYPDSQFYYMIIDEEAYMSFVVPAILLFAGGLFLNAFNENKRIELVFNSVGNIETFGKRGFILIFIGFTASIAIPFLPSSLKYLFLLLSYMKIIGAFYLFLSNQRFKWIWVIIAFSGEVLTAFGNAMFHDMILWAGYLFILYSFAAKIKLSRKIIIIGFILFSVVLIQYIKSDYREVVWSEKSLDNTSKLGLASDLASNTLGQSDLLNKEDKIQSLVDRINQGWIIARIIHMVPHFEPYADGETIREGIEGALLPRFLSPDKVKSGGKENFTRFTGIIISDNTSMDLSILGEAYANYGYFGAIVFMFILGLFYNLIFKLIIKKAIKHPELLVWIPFVFFYTVKAENDFATALNQLTKSILLMITVIYLLNKIVPLKSKTSKI